MGRSILVVLLAKILVISRMSANHTPQWLPIIIYHLCSMLLLLPSRCEQGGVGQRDTESTRAALSRSVAAT